MLKVRNGKRKKEGKGKRGVVVSIFLGVANFPTVYMARKRRQAVGISD